MSLLSTLAQRGSAQQWKRSLIKTALWFGAALFVTHQITERISAHPIFVKTPSIDVGFYWLNLKDKTFSPGDYVAFEFEPRAELAALGYPAARHTKQILGVPGDLIRRTPEGNFEVCSGLTGDEDHDLANCADAGRPMPVNKQGKAMPAWLEAGQTHTLGPDHYWVYAPHPSSLDSRYNGPIFFDQIKGKASKLYIFKKYSEYLN